MYAYLAEWELTLGVSADASIDAEKVTVNSQHGRLAMR